VDQLEINSALEFEDLVVVFYQSRQDLNILVESIFPKALSQLNISVEFCDEGVNGFQLLQRIEIDLSIK
jgi:hypothetical protein